MTKDDIVLMAQKAGPLTQGPFEEWCKRFAALVALAEREACAKLARKIGDATEPDDWALDKCQDIEAAIRARRTT